MPKQYIPSVPVYAINTNTILGYVSLN